MTAKPRQPARLGVAGRALWRRLVAEYEFEAAELVILAAAAKQADDIERLEVALAEGNLVVEGSAGQVRLNQALAELRLGRLAFAKLITQLRLPTGDDEVGRTAASSKAQRAAHARWDRVRRLQAVPNGSAS